MCMFLLSCYELNKFTTTINEIPVGGVRLKQVKNSNFKFKIDLIINMESKLENLISCRVILFPLLLSALFQSKITQMIPRWYILELHFARKCQAYQAHIYDRGKLEGELSKVGKILLSLAKSIRQVRHWKCILSICMCLKLSRFFAKIYA